jgi:phage-related minor tail protein
VQDQIDQLNKYHDKIVTNAQQQLAFDAQIHTLELQKQKDQDDLLLKVGNATDGFKVFFDELTNDGVSAAKKVNDALTTTFNNFTDTLAKALSGQKVSWANFLQSIEEMILKLVISSAFKQLFSALGDIGGGGIGGIFGGIASLFGGGRASGGSVSAGSIYEVGEQGKEWFVPQTSGMIVPNSALANKSSSTGGAPVSIYQNFTVNTPSPDAFRASQDQITSAGLASAMRAARRNG